MSDLTPEPGPPRAGAPEEIACILLVDDVQRYVELLKNYLRRTSCRIITESRGEETLAVCRREKPDLVFLDASIDDPGGIDLCRSLKSDPILRAIPVVLVAPREMSEQCREAGCDDILSKPVAQDEFLARVRRFVELREREEGRIPASLRLRYRSRSGEVTAYTKDLSPHGTFIKTTAPLALGARLKVTLHLLKKDAPITLNAEVMRVVRPAADGHLLPGMGVRFLEVTPSERRALERFINERLSGPRTGS